MPDDSFEKEEEMDDKIQQPVEEPKIKVGEEEYTQEDLQRLVGLGKIGVEAEEKYGVTLDKVWPNHQRTINEKLSLENKLAEIEKARIEQKVDGGQTLTEEEVARRAKEELNKLGYVSRDEVEKITFNMVEGFRLRDNAQGLIDQMVADGYPETSVDNLINHMADTGIKVPEKAYKDMFESQIDQIKENKLQSLKQPGLVTQESSSAGSKSPAPQKITNENLQEALSAALKTSSNL